MYIEASSPRRRGDIALLTSEEFFRTSSSGRCIKFWYHMYGNSIGSLNIYYKTNATKQIIWGLSGHQTTNRGSGGWKFGQAPIRSNVVYQVWFSLMEISIFECTFYMWGFGGEVVSVLAFHL
jgi:hypothetical protein